MRLMKRAWIAASFAALVTAFYAAPADACRCMPDRRPVREQQEALFKDADAVFLGSVIDVRHGRGRGMGSVAKLKVLRGWKGAMVGKHVELGTAMATSCSRRVSFDVGGTYLVFASRGARGAYSVADRSMCRASFSGPRDRADAAIKWLDARDGKPDDGKYQALVAKLRELIGDPPSGGKPTNLEKVVEQLEARLKKINKALCGTRNRHPSRKEACNKPPCSYKCVLETGNLRSGGRQIND